MTIHKGDVLFTRTGRPTLITSRNPKTGEVSTNEDLKTIAEKTRFGIKNGLNPDQRKSFESARTEVVSNDKKQEILKLRERIGQLKQENGDKKVVQYLENELQHLIIREDYVPSDYMVDERTLVK